MTTFNQIPPNPHADPIYYTVIDGEVEFADIPDADDTLISVIRSGAMLHMEIGENLLRVEFKDNDEEVDHVLIDFWELISSRP